jgi:hypothetical protein
MQERNNDKAKEIRHHFQKKFWAAEFDGEPVWYIAAMIAVGIYFGVMAETLRAGEPVVAVALIASMVSILYLHLFIRRRG